MEVYEGSPIYKHLQTFLQKRDPPKTFCPSEVARALSAEELEAEGAKEWRDLMPQIRELAWRLRRNGKLEVLQKSQVLDQRVTLDQVKGPIRIRRLSRDATYSET